MNRLKLVKWIMVSVSVVMLSACGGGGGDSAPSTPVAPTPEEIQQEAIETISNYDGSAGTEAPTVEDYELAGVTGVNEGNIDSVNEAIVEDDGVATEDDIQDVADVAGLVYEDAENEDTNGWSVYNNNSNTATITNVIDADKANHDDKGSRVIQLKGNELADGFRFGAEWNNEKQKIIKWSLKFEENKSFIIYVKLNTLNGIRYLRYAPYDIRDNELADPAGVIYYNFNLTSEGYGYRWDGTWQTIRVDLIADLVKKEPGNEIVTVDAFLVRGSGMIDDIEFE